MKVYSPQEIADLLKLKVSTIRKYSIMLEELGYEFDKNSRNQRYYADRDIITLRKIVTFKDNGMTLGEAVESVMLWHRGNESEEEDLTPYQTDTQDVTHQYNEDIQELKNIVQEQSDMISKQNEMIGQLFDRLDKQQEYIDQRLAERDQALMQTLNQSLETRKQLAASENEQERPKRKGFWKRLFGKGEGENDE